MDASNLRTGSGRLLSGRPALADVSNCDGNLVSIAWTKHAQPAIATTPGALSQGSSPGPSRERLAAPRTPRREV